jgi:hypothetical protein
VREVKYNPGVAIAAILGVSFMLSMWLLGNCLLRSRRGAETIHVTGSAHRTIRSDYIIWQCNLVEERSTITDAYTRIHAEVGKVNDYLRSQGIPAEETFSLPIATVELHPPVNTNTEINDASVSRPVLGYRLTQGIQVRSHDVETVDKAARNATELVSSGVPVSSEPPQYLYTKMDTLKLEMLNEAAKDAHSRAAGIAENCGSRLGALKSARMGVLQIEALSATDGATDSGANDTTSLDKKVTAIVKADFTVR